MNRSVRKQTIKKPKYDNEIEEMKNLGFEYIGTDDDFEIPKWWDCVWRRKACWKNSCKICGKIKKDRQRHIARGEDPDDMKVVIQDMGGDFKRALQMIRKDAERMGIDITNLNQLESREEPPEPEEFPLCRALSEWQVAVHELTKEADEAGEKWVEAEATADLLWYKNTLQVKTYRQLCNRWEMDRGNKYSDIDYKYTKYVLEECLNFLKDSLSKLSYRVSSRKTAMMILLARLNDLEKETLKI